MIKSSYVYATERESATSAEIQDRFEALMEKIQRDVSELFNLDAEVAEELVEYTLTRNRYPLCFLDVSERMALSLHFYRHTARRLSRAFSELILLQEEAEEGEAA
jgi:hypothetical protein